MRLRLGVSWLHGALGDGSGDRKVLDRPHPGRGLSTASRNLGAASPPGLPLALGSGLGRRSRQRQDGAEQRLGCRPRRLRHEYSLCAVTCCGTFFSARPLLRGVPRLPPRRVRPQCAVHGGCGVAGLCKPFRNATPVTSALTTDQCTFIPEAAVCIHRHRHN